MEKLEGLNGPIWIKATPANVPYESLAPQSNKLVVVVCPMCAKEYNSPKFTITQKGHTRCQPCQQRIGAYGNLISQRIGRLVITGFGEPAIVASGGNRTTLTAICDCGNQTTVFAQSVKRAIKKNNLLSCGCVVIEHMKAQGINNAGPNNGMYRHDLSLEQRVAHKKLIRHIKRTWSKAIRRRDSICVICGCADNLEAHHLFSTVSKPEFCLSPENGITICTTHHQDFHCVFMGHVHTPTTPADFYSYLQTVHNWTNEQIESLIKDKQLARSDHAVAS